MGKRRIALAAIAAVLGASATAQEVSTQPDSAPAARGTSDDRILLIPAPPGARRVFAQAERVKTVDIPEHAKEQGHNGRATFEATVAADGSLAGLELVSSSKSDAIDAAVRSRAETLVYKAATDRDGRGIEGTVRVSMSYARYDNDSPGGGLDDYSCDNLIREYDWFTSAHNGQGPVFVPQLVYTTLDFWVHVANGEDVSEETIDDELAARRDMWPQFLDQCRSQPEARVLDVVDHPDIFREQIERY